VTLVHSLNVKGSDAMLIGVPAETALGDPEGRDTRPRPWSS